MSESDPYLLAEASGSRHHAPPALRARGAGRVVGPSGAFDASAERQELRALLGEISSLAEAFLAREPLLGGSLQRLRRRCGKAGCRCARGKLHESLVLVESSSGRRSVRTLSGREALKLQKPSSRYRSLRRLRARLRELQREVLRRCDRLTRARLKEARRLLR